MLKYMSRLPKVQRGRAGNPTDESERDEKKRVNARRPWCDTGVTHNV
jgi:hypothetical protein